MEFEQLDKEHERLLNRFGDHIFDDFTAKSLNDIKKAIAKIAPTNSVTGGQKRNIKINSVDKHGNEVVHNIDVDTNNQSKRSILLDAFTKLKNEYDLAHAGDKSISINGKKVDSIAIRNLGNRPLAIDVLLKRWLGATRDGLFIKWTLNNGEVYKYDIINHKLLKVE